MQDAIGPAGAIFLLTGYAIVMIAVTLVFTKRRPDKVEYLLASRNVGIPLGALSIAASWIWAPALFLAPQKAYEQGIPGVFWFVAPNFLALAVFAPLALQIRKRVPAGYTLPQYMHQRHGPAVHCLYVIQFYGLQLCSFAVQVLAGATLIHIASGLDYHLIASLIVLVVLVYSWLGGLRASIITDLLQMALVYLTLLALIPWAITRAGGFPSLAEGLGGLTGQYTNIFDPWVVYSFGISVTIGLLSGPIGDQMHWQRAYAMRSDTVVVSTFLLAAALFAVVPLSLSGLGFLAANPAVSAQWPAPSPQMIGPLVIANLLPPPMLILFTLMLLGSLSSTLDSILCASSSLIAVDIFKPKHTTHDDHSFRAVRIAKFGMGATAVLGLLIASIPGLQILHLFLFYGTWRASTMIPTVLTLYSDSLSSRAVFFAIMGSLCLGAPILAIGEFTANPHLRVAGSVLVLVIGLSVCAIGMRFPTKHEAGEPESDPLTTTGAGSD